MSVRDPFILAGKTYTSRLLVGTGKYKNAAETKAAVEASGAEIVTVAVRRLKIAGEVSGAPDSAIQELVDTKRYTLLPNSAGCYNAEDAVRTLRLARELSDSTLVKLEVLGDPKTLYPDVEQTLRAAEVLVKEGFDVMAYTTDDLIIARKLEAAGCVAVMPLAAPIGSGLGLLNPLNIRLMVQTLKVPVLVDAGIGTASDACIAMELGCAGVLLNTALSSAQNPVLMAQAMKEAVIAGRNAFLAGRMPKKEMATPSSPVDGLLSAKK